MRATASPPAARHGVAARAGQLWHQAKIALGARARHDVYTGPLYVQVGVVNTCNYRCQFCWDHPSYVAEGELHPDGVAQAYYRAHPEIDYDRAHMDWDMYVDLVDDLHVLGTRKIKFIGRGEPFAHRRFLDMVAYAKQRGFNCSTTTNGALITEQDVEALLRLGLDEIFVSVNAASPETYNTVHLRTPPAAFDRIKHTLQLLSSAKARRGTPRPFVHLSFVIQSNNYFEMPDMVRLAHEVGAQRVAFNRISVYPGTLFLLLTPAQDREIREHHLIAAERLAAEFSIETNADDFRGRPNSAQRSRAIHSVIPCYAGAYFSLILADGTVNPCCECLRSMGSLREQRFKDIWRGAAYRRFRGEARALPAAGRELPGCRCYNCGLATHNLSLHKFIHPFSRSLNGQARFTLRKLKRFVFQ